MKYFTLQTQQLFLDSLQIKEWSRQINTQWLCVDELYRVPKRMVFPVSLREFMPLPDIITFPFLMITDLVYQVVKMYGDMAFTRDIVLMDYKNDMQTRYYLLVFDDLAAKKIPIAERNIFYADIAGTRKLVVSLDFAESILRRGIVGITLEEISFTESEVHYG